MGTQKELRRKKRTRNYFFKLTKFLKLSRAKNLLDNFSDFFWKIPCLVKSWQGEGKKGKYWENTKSFFTHCEPLDIVSQEGLSHEFLRFTDYVCRINPSPNPFFDFRRRGQGRLEI